MIKIFSALFFQELNQYTLFIYILYANLSLESVTLLKLCSCYNCYNVYEHIVGKIANPFPFWVLLIKNSCVH